MLGVAQVLAKLNIGISLNICISIRIVLSLVLSTLPDVHAVDHILRMLGAIMVRTQQAVRPMSVRGGLVLWSGAAQSVQESILNVVAVLACTHSLGIVLAHVVLGGLWQRGEVDELRASIVVQDVSFVRLLSRLLSIVSDKHDPDVLGLRRDQAASCVAIAGCIRVSPNLHGFHAVGNATSFRGLLCQVEAAARHHFGAYVLLELVWTLV